MDQLKIEVSLPFKVERIRNHFAKPARALLCASKSLAFFIKVLFEFFGDDVVLSFVTYVGARPSETNLIVSLESPVMQYHEFLLAQHLYLGYYLGCALILSIGAHSGQLGSWFPPQELVNTTTAYNMIVLGRTM